MAWVLSAVTHQKQPPGPPRELCFPARMGWSWGWAPTLPGVALPLLGRTAPSWLAAVMTGFLGSFISASLSAGMVAATWGVRRILCLCVWYSLPTRPQ